MCEYVSLPGIQYVLVKDLEPASNEKIHLMTDTEATVVAVTEIHNKAAEADAEEAAAEE